VLVAKKPTQRNYKPDKRRVREMKYNIIGFISVGLGFLYRQHEAVAIAFFVIANIYFVASLLVDDLKKGSGSV
jgi:4-amino-4-deoxy-L-arabinose transferase-like glycosyltransferase